MHENVLLLSYHKKMVLFMVGNRLGRPNGVYDMTCYSLSWPGLFSREVKA